MSLLKLTIFYRNRKKKSCFLYHTQFFNLWHITFISSSFNTRFGLIKFMSNEHMKRKENQKACKLPISESVTAQWKAFEAWLTARTSLQWCSETPMMLWREELSWPEPVLWNQSKSSWAGFKIYNKSSVFNHLFLKCKEVVKLQYVHIIN